MESSHTHKRKKIRKDRGSSVACNVSTLTVTFQGLIRIERSALERAFSRAIQMFEKSLSHKDRSRCVRKRIKGAFQREGCGHFTSLRRFEKEVPKGDSGDERWCKREGKWRSR
jgi:hypothetical protein